MKKVFIFIVSSILPIVLSTQELDDFIRKENESSIDYVQRVKSTEDTLAYDVIETYEWDTKNPSIIAFCNIPRDKENISEVIGHVYMKQYDVEYYRDITFGDFIGESEYPEIIDVFWMNVDNDKEKELFVLFRYFSLHYDFTGYVYDLAILDNPNIYCDCLENIALFGDTFISFEGMNGEGIESIPTYTTKEEVITKLNELGY
jgi:hypothetical protein